ncbi:MAG: ATP-binding protein [Clostridiales bacterium]|jgi:hypothetical protein|nr:ATP-binding protein [Clostridiales bacterium]
MVKRIKDRTRIDASPTKDFFIHMLVKDINLSRAIADLVDNSVDGAKRLRRDGNYNGLSVRVRVSKDEFKISDNCGGIPEDLARKYAFRFGRAEGMPNDTPHSIGQFGVGMKRALFKLGNYFRIESKTNNSRFVVEQDVKEWATDKDNWDFKFVELEDSWSLPSGDEAGTTITVTQLHPTVAEEFEIENFRTRLKTQLESAHQINLDLGLAITLNELPLGINPVELLISSQLTPTHKEILFPIEGEKEVKVTIYAGIAHSDPQKAGWFVFCNGRLILDSDKTVTTGWGDGNPLYHNQFARFRGYVFFDSDDPRALPWNTTKSDVDTSSSIYKSIRLEMITIMRPIITFLNRLDAEKKNKEEEQDSTPLEKAIEEAKSVNIKKIVQEQIFSAPKPIKTITLQKVNRITYAKPMDQVNRVKKVLKVRTNQEVGERTFEYFLKMECE